MGTRDHPGGVEPVRDLILTDEVLASVLSKKQLEVVHARRRGISFRDIGLHYHIHEATARGHYQAALKRLETYIREAA